MKAIILAAGLGSRLGKKSGGLPKALLRIGGRPLIEHQLEALSSEGVGPVVVVVGHEAEQIRAVLHDAVEYVLNERHAETNSLYSLWLAREWLDGETLLLNSDLFFDPEILRRLLRARGSALAYDSTSHHGGEKTKVGLVGRRVVDLGKDFPATGARGENLGLIKLDARGAEALRTRAEAIIASGDETVWVTEAVRSVLADVHMTGVNVAGLPWAEIDFPYDLEQARKVVWPAIERQSHPHRRLWRKVRWPATLAAVLAAAALVWFVSSIVGPASVDWETLTPMQGTRVRVQRAERGPQKWWLLRANETLTVTAEGGPLRIEARPAFPTDGPDTVAFAIAIRVDGTPYLYLAGRGGSDPDVTFREGRLGERERKEFTIPPGQHVVTLQLVEGDVSVALVRVRQPEES